MTYPLLHWVEAEDSWMKVRGFMEWRCYCDAEIRVDWRSTCSLYDTDEPIDTAGALASSWQVECFNGHVLLLCHELSDDQSSDNYPPPTTADIVKRLASSDDVAAWLSYEPPKPPFDRTLVQESQP